MKLQNLEHSSSIEKRGIKSKSSKSDQSYPVGPIVLGLFLFLVVGSVIFNALNSFIGSNVIV